MAKHAATIRRSRRWWDQWSQEGRSASCGHGQGAQLSAVKALSPLRRRRSASRAHAPGRNPPHIGCRNPTARVCRLISDHHAYAATVRHTQSQHEHPVHHTISSIKGFPATNGPGQRRQTATWCRMDPSEAEGHHISNSCGHGQGAQLLRNAGEGTVHAVARSGRSETKHLSQAHGVRFLVLM